MDELKQLTGQALHIIHHLSAVIGPRLAGSTAEMKAMDYAKNQLEKAGYQTSFHPVSYPNTPTFFPYLSLYGLFLLIAAMATKFFSFNFLWILTPFIVGGLPDIYAQLQALLPPKNSSKNLTASHPSQQWAQADIILCAHIDSARVMPRAIKPIQWLLNRVMQIMELISWISAAIAIMAIVGFSGKPIYNSVLEWFGLAACLIFIAIDLWQQLGAQGRISPGANDNASGVAISLALMEYFLQQPLKHLTIATLITTAEEAGLYGSQTAASLLQQSNSHPLVINLDMLGYGKQPGAVSRIGRLHPLATDKTVNAIIHSHQPPVRWIDYQYRSGDAVSFIKKQIQTISLESTNRGMVPPTYHRDSDTISNIDPDAIQLSLALVLDIIHKLDTKKIDG